MRHKTFVCATPREALRARSEEMRSGSDGRGVLTQGWLILGRLEALEEIHEDCCEYDAAAHIAVGRGEGSNQRGRPEDGAEGRTSGGDRKWGADGREE